MSRKLNSVATMHLEPGDALVVDARVFNAADMHFANAPRDVRIFPVIPVEGQSIRDAFTTVHSMELERLTRDKLTELMRVFLGNCGGHASAIIDGIEADFCRCRELLDSEGQEISEGLRCAIHERCAALRELFRQSEGERACICDGIIKREDCPVHKG